MDEINAIAARHGLPVIEDAAQSFGATYKGRKSCNLSTIGCTSFFPRKPLGCYGDGGAIFTDDDALAQAMREIRVHGQSGRYHHTRDRRRRPHGHLQCAVVLGQARALRVGDRTPASDRAALRAAAAQARTHGPRAAREAGPHQRATRSTRSACPIATRRAGPTEAARHPDRRALPAVAAPAAGVRRRLTPASRTPSRSGSRARS